MWRDLRPIRSRSIGHSEHSARLVLIGSTELVWQRARYREGQYLFTPTDPVLVGLNTLQHWLWQRLAIPSIGEVH